MKTLLRHSLARKLLDGGEGFSFFQAVRLLHLLEPDAPRVGRQGPPQKECIRFTSHLGLGFPSSDVTSIEEDEARRPMIEEGEEELSARYRLAVTFLGLYGPSSPLPSSYTEDLLDQEPDSLERTFYDFFNHRLVSLFYRCWERYRYEVVFRPDGSDYFSQRLGTLLHLDRSATGPKHLPWLRMLALAGLLSQSPRSAASLSAALKSLFPGVSVWVEAFQPRWVPIPAYQHCRLGLANTTLGEDAYLGREIRDAGSTFRLGLEVDDLAQYMRFLPSGEEHSRVRQVVGLFNTNMLDYEVELRLMGKELPAARLGAAMSRLGWSTWIGVPPAAERRVRILCQGATDGAD